MSRLATFADVKTPESPSAQYDWTKEPWVNEAGITDLEYTQAFHIVTAMSADARNDDATAQDEEDAKVFALIRPDVTEPVIRSPHFGEIGRYRVVTAIAIGLRLVREAWVQKYGSAEAKGAKRGTRLDAEIRQGAKTETT